MSVIDLQDSTILLSIRSPADFRVQPGLNLNISRSFQMDEQRDEYLEYLRDKMQYYERTRDSVKYNSTAADLEFIVERNYIDLIPEGHVFVTGDFIGTARLEEVYDSTGKASIVSHVAWSKPKAGDSMEFD